MKREIKFRIWNRKKEKMGIVYEMSTQWANVIYSDKSGDTHLFFSDNDLMQYTGYQDKNDKEIYEGDILSCIETKIKGKQTKFGKVEVCFGEYDDSEIEYRSSGIGWYVKGYYGYIRENGSNNIYYIGKNDESEWSLNKVLDWRIIGNIYEFPELLK